MKSLEFQEVSGGFTDFQVSFRRFQIIGGFSEFPCSHVSSKELQRYFKTFQGAFVGFKRFIGRQKSLRRDLSRFYIGFKGISGDFKRSRELHRLSCKLQRVSGRFKGVSRGFPDVLGGFKDFTWGFKARRIKIISVKVTGGGFSEFQQASWCCRGVKWTLEVFQEAPCGFPCF